MSQTKNIAIAQQLLAGIAEGKTPDALAAIFSEKLRFEIQGDDGRTSVDRTQNRPSGPGRLLS
jgi:hypothetical protein